MSDVVKALPEPPKPDDLPAFVPFACGQLMASFRVRFITHMQEAYTCKEDTKESRKSRAALAHAVVSHASATREDSMAVKVSKTDLEDNSEVITVRAVTDAAHNVLEISIDPCAEIPRLLIKIISLCIPFNPYLTKITMQRGLSGATLYETIKILNTSQITEICLDDSRVPERNYYLLVEYQTRLQLLSLSRCNLTDEDCAQLFSKLAYPYPASKFLNTLYLTGNLISNEGARLIGHFLRSNRTLIYLNLSGNRISNEGAAHIFKSLMEFPLTTDEIIMKRRNRLLYIRLRQEVYNKCIDELLSPALADTADEASRSSKRRNTSLRTKKQPSTKLVLTNYTSKDSDIVSVKAEKMTSELMSPFTDPFRVEATVSRDNILYSKGNLALCYLNLAYNNLGYQSVVKLTEVVKYQLLVSKHPDLGLASVQLDGNPLPKCDELCRLSDMLTRALQVRLMYTTHSFRRGDRGKKSKIN